MKDKSWIVIVGIIAVIFSLKLLPAAVSLNETVLIANSSADLVEIIHFHATQQCYSCRTLGNLTEQTVNTYYSDELESGKITFRHINIDLEANAELVKQYQVTGSALMIGTKIGDAFNIEENVQAWYKIGNEIEFMTYLKGLIDKRLSGDLSQ